MGFFDRFSRKASSEAPEVGSIQQTPAPRPERVETSTVASLDENPYLIEEIVRKTAGASAERMAVIAGELAATGRPDACPAIASIARSVPDYQVLDVLETLASMGPVAFDEMAALTQDSQFKVRTEAISCIRDIGDPRVAGVLVDLLERRRDDDVVYDKACYGLRKVGDRSVVPRLEALLQGQSDFRKTSLQKAIEALS